MRVISGEAKGRRLRAVPGMTTRPTTDRVRQTIFDILGDVAGTQTLDLFAGTGALGIEAISRGAAHAVFVEISTPAVAIIKANLGVTGFADRATIRRRDAEKMLSESASSSFDLVFLDPPYERGLAFVARMLGRIATGGWVNERGIVVVETETGALEVPDGLHEVRTKIFGGTQITMFERGTGEPG